jgi:hypothetical protein
MLYIAPKDASTRVLRSLLKAYWMPDGPLVLALDGVDAIEERARRKQRRKSRGPKNGD